MSTYVFIEFHSIRYTIPEVYRMSDMQLDPVVVGNVIAKFRIERNLTQEVLSGLSDIGRTHLSAIERGERKPTLETLYRISCALGIPMSRIVLDIETQLNASKSE